MRASEQAKQQLRREAQRRLGAVPGVNVFCAAGFPLLSAGMVNALTAALQLVDLDHPQAIKAVHAILRPLEILTRAWPKRPAAAAAAAAAGVAGGASGEGAGTGAQGVAGGALGVGAAPGPAGSAGGGAAPPPQGLPAATPAGEAPEAGRQALRAAEAAFENLDRDRARAERRTSEWSERMFVCVVALSKWLALPHACTGAAVPAGSACITCFLFACSHRLCCASPSRRAQSRRRSRG